MQRLGLLLPFLKKNYKFFYVEYGEVNKISRQVDSLALVARKLKTCKHTWGDLYNHVVSRASGKQEHSFEPI
jgi:hypothetical protein